MVYVNEYDALSESTRKAMEKIAKSAKVPKINLPTLPKINVPTVPKIDVRLPQVQGPDLSQISKTIEAMTEAMKPVTSLSRHFAAATKNSPMAKAFEALNVGSKLELPGFDTFSEHMRQTLDALAKSGPIVDVNAAFGGTLQDMGERRAQALEDVDRHTDALRAAVIAASEAGWSEVELAEKAGVDRMTIRRWLAKR